MNWKQAALGTFGAIALLTTAACGGTTEPGGNAQGGKTGTDITVKDNTNTSVYQSFKLEKIDKLPNMRGITWLSDDWIVSDKENKSLKPVTVEGEERYPHNLYMYDLTKGTDTPLKESEASLGAPLVSQDGQYLFYREPEENTGKGYFLNLHNGETTPAGKEDGFIQEGAWLDNEHVVFPNMKGDLISASVDGTTKVLVETGNFNVRSIKVSGDMLYYITGEDGQLNAYDAKTGDVKQVLKSVEWVIPSNDGTRLAIVKRTADTKRALVLTDLEGNEKATSPEAHRFSAQAGRVMIPRLRIRSILRMIMRKGCLSPTRSRQNSSRSRRIWTTLLTHSPGARKEIKSCYHRRYWRMNRITL